MYDLIGDIHGHADELEQLLRTLGYDKIRGVYRHPERSVIFLGDFIDRGSKIREVLELVRPMVLEGAAQAVMGNHEFNALAYHTDDPDLPGEFLRRHSAKNAKQHGQTLQQLTPQELGLYLEWFRSLPLWLEVEGLRAVHACWDDAAMATIAAALQEHGGITPSVLSAASRKGSPLFTAVEVVLKGKEAMLPDGAQFADKDGHVRSNVRTRWYLPPRGQTFRTYALQSDVIDCDAELDASTVTQAVPYPADAKPVFTGHYWLTDDHPAILASNVACLDYSVAKGGFLCAYRWHGEQMLTNKNFVVSV